MDRTILRKRTTALAIVAAIGAAGWGGWSWWDRARFRETTDNAYVRGDITAVGAKVSGYVADVLVSDNQIIQAGEIVARVDEADFLAQVDRAQAALSQADAAAEHLERRRRLQLALIREADAAVLSAKADVELAQRNLDRSGQLVVQGWTPQRAHDVATADSRRGAASLARVEAAAAAAREQLGVISAESAQIVARQKEAEANLRLAYIALADTVIRAPVAGVIGNKRVQPGEFIRPGAVLMSIVPVDGVWVVANFKETQVARMRVGQGARISVDGYSGATLSGTIDSLAPASGAAFSLLPPDNATGNFTKIVQRVPVKIRLASGHALVGRLVPGLSVEATIDLRSGDGRPIAETGSVGALTATFRSGG